MTPLVSPLAQAAVLVVVESVRKSLEDGDLAVSLK